ncbi:MAG: hypothetical protein LW750_04040 [Bacteroidetes bacterium]|jgi:hypothetical protein|nr:hypothetical protein [Bacteroidota bacterium]
MKKLFVVLALAGMVGTVSATTVSAINGSEIVVVKGGDKKKKKKKGCCSGDAKAADGKTSCADGAKKEAGCCKDKKADAAPKQ